MSNQDRKQTQSSESNEENKGSQSEDWPVKGKEDMQQRLGLGLKNMYLSVLEEPLPDDMLALLDQLDEKDDVNSDRPDKDD